MLQVNHTNLKRLKVLALQALLSTYTWNGKLVEHSQAFENLVNKELEKRGVQ
jgi:hypothetical protein